MPFVGLAELLLGISLTSFLYKNYSRHSAAEEKST